MKYKIVVGKTSGFCEGVSYTVKQAFELVNEKNSIVYCLGEIVHNEYVVSELARMGTIFVDSIEDVPSNSKLIIRAHGATKETYEKAKNKNINICDLTCGRIRVIRNKIECHNNDFIVIIGKKDHPETCGTLSFCNDGFILEDENDFDALENSFNKSGKNSIYIVSQTTFNEDKFLYLCNKITEKFEGYDVCSENTVCNATHKRQEETKEIAKKVDCMIIVGGKKSSNTKELFNIAKDNCEKAIIIQDKSNLDEYIDVFDGVRTIGIMAGASTPEITVKEVIAKFNV